MKRGLSAAAAAIIALWTAVGPICAADALSDNEVRIVKSGEAWGDVDAYRIGEDMYLPAKAAARIYGAQMYWYAVRGMVRLSFRGRQILLTGGAKTAVVDGKKAAMPQPMIVRAGKAFIPVRFFASKAFARVAGVRSTYQADQRTLLVDHRNSVGPIRWFTYPKHTRVVLELDNRLSFQKHSRGRYGLDLTIPNGMIGSSERVDIGDGVLSFFHLRQESQQARLTLKLQKSSDGFEIKELKKPRRIVIDIKRSRDAVLEGKMRRVGFEAPASPKQRKKEKKRARKIAKKAKRSVKKTEPSDSVAVEAPPVPAAVARAEGRVRVVVDPGHGGKDGGAVGRRGTLEKTLNLEASIELAALLRADEVFDVILTRDSDKFVKLRKRSKIANDFNADLFISIHCNAAEQRSLSGFEVYFLSERASDPEAERLAEFENSVLAIEGDDVVEDEAAELLYALARTEFMNDAAELAGLMTRGISRRVDLRNRGVKQAAFYVLRGANQPAVLVEMAFLTNGRDEAKLNSKKYRRKIVKGMHAGILDYAKRKGWLEIRK